MKIILVSFFMPYPIMNIGIMQHMYLAGSHESNCDHMLVIIQAFVQYSLNTDHVDARGVCSPNCPVDVVNSQ